MAVVMVVDDEDVLLEMLALLVDELGHQPLTATNGLEALTHLKSASEPPALIISDVMMPCMNGVELARTVKQNPLFRSIPVLLMSAAFRPAMEAVADRFIHKPFDLDEVAGMIEDYLASRA